MKRQASFWLKLPGDTLVIMLSGIALTFIEVFLYSQLYPGQGEQAYEAHANKSGPWISAITGFILMFVFTRRFIRNRKKHHLLYATGLPVLYILLDGLIFILLDTDWKETGPVFLLSNTVKFSGSLIAYFIAQKSDKPRHV